MMTGADAGRPCAGAMTWYPRVPPPAASVYRLVLTGTVLAFDLPAPTTCSTAKPVAPSSTTTTAASHPYFLMTVGRIADRLPRGQRAAPPRPGPGPRRGAQQPGRGVPLRPGRPALRRRGTRGGDRRERGDQ